MARVSTITFDGCATVDTVGKTVEPIWRTGASTASGVASSPVHTSGGQSWKLSHAAYQQTFLRSTPVLGGVTEIYMRFYIYPVSMPNETIHWMTMYTNEGGNGITLDIDSGHHIRLAVNLTAGSFTTGTLTQNAWNLIELHLKSAGASSVWEGKLNAEAFSTTYTGYSLAFQNDLWYDAMGWNDATEYYVDDIAINDTTGSYQNSWPGAGYSTYSRPTADSNRGVWTNGTGGTTNLYDAVNNTPPSGLITPSATSQIEDANGGTNQDAVFTMQSYTTVGVGSSDTINLICSCIRCGAGDGSGYVAKTWVASNPSDSPPSSSLSSNTAIADEPSVAWKTFYGDSTYVPSVSKGTQPTQTIRQVSVTASDTTHCDWMGILIDWTVGTVPPVESWEGYDIQPDRSQARMIPY